MKVVFVQNIKSKAQIGDIKEVASGYARNYLIPRGIAIPADKPAMKYAKLLQEKHRLEREGEEKWAKHVANIAEGVNLEFEMEANEEGHLYGSVSAEEIVEKARKFDLELKPEDLKLDKPIKNIGKYSIPIILPEDYKASLSVVVTKRQTKE